MTIEITKQHSEKIVEAGIDIHLLHEISKTSRNMEYAFLQNKSHHDTLELIHVLESLINKYKERHICQS